MDIAGYRIESLLGRGGMSVVYIAEQVRLGRKVALKLLSSDLGFDTHFRERFVRESQMAATIDHPNIIPIYDAGESEAGLYIAMRYVPGPDLKTILKRDERLSVGRTIFIIEQVASALDTAHARGLIHRDVKPANVLIEEGTDHAFLTDFGVAKQTTAPGLTSVGAFLGTYEYAAPEQIERREVDRRADVYALGCLLYECLTGSPPYDRASEIEISNAHLTEPPPAPTQRRPELPNELDHVVATAMAKKPDDRYQSAGALANAARNAAVGRRAETRDSELLQVAAPTVASDRGGSGTVITTPPPPGGGTPSEPAGAPASRRRRWLIPALIAALLLVGGGTAAAVILTRDNGNSDKGSMGTSGQMTTGAMTSEQTTTGAMANGGGTTTGMSMNNGEQPAAQVMQSLISQYNWNCTKDPIDAPAGAQMTEDCRTGVPQYLQINIYPSKHALNMEYAKLLSDAGLKSNEGACSAGSWGGEQRWVHGLEEVGGRVFCYLGNNKTYMTWTGGGRFLVIARMDGINHPNLFYWWRRNIRHQLV
jgi:serine/threonine protein kinase